MDFVECLATCLKEMNHPTSIELYQMMESMEISIDSITKYITEPEQFPYGRNVIYRTEQVEVIVLNLPAGRHTSLHDHGNSIGCAWVAQGTLNNQIYEINNHGFPVCKASDRLQSGDYFMAPKGQIHRMVNPGSERVISLHMYAPPLTNMKIYEDGL